MKSGLKLLLMGGLFGFLVVFAIIGVQSLMSSKENNALVSQSDNDNGFQEPTIKGAVTATETNNNSQAPSSTQPAATSTNADSGVTQDQQTAAPDNNANNNQNSVSHADVADEDDTKITLIDEYGELRLTLVDPNNPAKRPRGTFIIRDEFNAEVATINEVDTASFDLSPGIYEVTVIAEGKKSARMVEIALNQVVREQFDLPRTNQPVVVQQPVQQPSTSGEGSNTQAQIPAVTETAPAETTASAPDPVQRPEGQLTVQVRAAGSNVPLKANIYVQKPNGVHVTKQNYADNAAFALVPGVYRLTVKTKGKRDEVRDINIVPNRNVRQLIAMQPLASPPPRQQEHAELEGTVNMVLDLGSGVRGRFVVQNAQGRRVARVGGVADASVRLRPGRYTVVAVHRRERARKRIVVREGENTAVIFRQQDFPNLFRNNRPNASTNSGSNRQSNQNNNTQEQTSQQQSPPAVENKGGLLQLIAVSGIDQRPLPVSFSVTALNGRVLQNYNNVSFAELNIPPQDVLVNIRYREMSGQERIRVKADEPTVFTFTITPNNAVDPVGQQDQPPPDLEEMLLERLQQEILKRIQ